MSAYNLLPQFNCPTWRDTVLDRLPWLEERMACSGCGKVVLVFRQLGINALDEVHCSDCAAGPRTGSQDRGL